jgi:UDP-N-acetylglucosamine-lysosomal-enzyme
MWLGKTIQRRILHLLSDRTTFLAVLAGLLLLVVSFLSFGEAWLQWSADKYSAIFNSFSDNVAGRSLQSRLCQYVPIDVVYTWVNGSDPLFQDGLKHAKERLRNDPDRKLRLLKSCPFENCAPSHFLTTDSLLPQNTQLEYLRAQNAFLSQDLVDFKDQVWCS